jgi:actin-related protein
MLFQPSISNLPVHKNSIGVHELIQSAIQKCDHEIRKDLYGSVVLSGGNTLFSGMNERIYKELSGIAPSNFQINVSIATLKYF